MVPDAPSHGSGQVHELEGGHRDLRTLSATASLRALPAASLFTEGENMAENAPVPTQSRFPLLTLRGDPRPCPASADTRAHTRHL